MATKQLSTQEGEQLLNAAREVAARAYAPYSKFHVGAAVLTDSGKVFQGCNVENASFGLTICAERSAIFASVAGEGSDMRVRAVAVVTSDGEPASPCGACRQVMLEFNPDAVVIFQGESGVIETTVRELLPHAFRLD